MFTFIDTPGHGYLKVPIRAIPTGIIKQITQCSPKTDNFYYLEEDQDAGLFIEWYIRAHGINSYSDFWNNHTQDRYVETNSLVDDIYERGDI